ncbi:MAG: peptidoglycan-binding protein [Microbacterium chocolatum]|nr:peptidoglycan-binding protein [Microbacterium chocolatum]
MNTQGAETVVRATHGRPWMAGVRSSLTWVIAVVLTAVVTWWAASVTFARPTEETEMVEPQTVTVADATVDRSLSVGVTVAREVATIATNLLSGVVTQASSEYPVSEGEVVYTVGNVPVVAVQGSAPFYRELTVGNSGADVATLQAALQRLGYLAGAPDGRFGEATAGALRALQRDLGAPVTGAAGLGQFLAVPTLPSAITVGADIFQGALLSGGEDAVRGSTGDPEFRVTLSPDRFQQIPAEASFRVFFNEDQWDAVVSGSTVDENQNIILELSAPDGGEVCGDRCGDLPSGELTTLRGEAVIAAPQSGPAIAAAAIRSSSEGSPYVVLSSGERVDVVVRASQGGVAVGDGVAIGDVVVLPEGADPADGSSEGSSGESVE